jgi:hypothetical protein
MSTTFKQLHLNLSMLAKQGHSLLSCENITPLQVTAYKELVDGVLSESDLRLEDIDQMTAAKAVGQSYSSEAVEEEEEEEDLAETELSVDEIVDAEIVEEEDPAIEIEETPELDELEQDLPIESDADTDVLDADNTAVEPAEELAETVDKVDHIVQRVETFIAVTEDSGLSTDDIQAMAASNESFESVRHIHKLASKVSMSGSSDLITAFSRLTQISLRNIGKSIV